MVYQFKDNFNIRTGVLVSWSSALRSHNTYGGIFGPVKVNCRSRSCLDYLVNNIAPGYNCEHPEALPRAIVGRLTFVLAFQPRAVKRHFTRSKRPQATKTGANEEDEKFLQPVEAVFLFAIFMDLVQGVAQVLSARWAFQGQVTEGGYCSAQGDTISYFHPLNLLKLKALSLYTAALKQFGNIGAALATIAIAVHTAGTNIMRKMNTSIARMMAMYILTAVFLL